MQKWATLFLLLPLAVYGQTEVPFQTSSTAGSGTVENSTSKLIGSFGQPIAASGSATLQSGFMGSVFVYINNAAPVFAFDAPDLIHANDKIQVDIADYNIDSAAFFYRPIAAAKFDSIKMTAGIAPKFEATVLATGLDAMGMEYYFTAVDETGKTSRSPASETEYHHSYVDASTAFVPSSAYKTGTKKSEYRMITLPFTFSNASVSEQFDELGSFDKKVYRIATYDNGNWKEYPDDFTSFEKGRGYWFLTTNTSTLKLAGAETPLNHRSNLAEITLKPNAWNQVGNPYSVPVNWNDVRNLYPGIKIGAVKKFAGSYSDGNTLQPYEGGFVYFDEGTAKTVKIPFQGQTQEGGRTKQEFSPDISSDAWMLNISLQQNDVVNTLAAIGMHNDALLTSDYYDDFYPPHFAEYAEIDFSHPEHNLKVFAKDIVTHQDKNIWSFTVDATSFDPLIMQWSNEEFGNNTIDLYLYDVTNSRIVNMREANQYRIVKGSSYRIYYGENVVDDIRPEVATVGQVYPNPLNNAMDVHVPFALPGKHDQFQVKVELYNNQGQVVRKLLDKTLPSGFYDVLWNGNDVREQACSNGLYVYRVVIVKTGKESVFTGKIMLAK